MAKVKKKRKKLTKAEREDRRERVQARRDAKADKKATKQGKKIARRFTPYEKAVEELGITDPLERLDLSALDDLLDPESESYIGRSDEVSSKLASSEENREKLLALLDEAGVRSDEMQGVLSDLDDTNEKAKNALARATKRSDDMNEVLGLMKGGLAGLNSEENLALRERAKREAQNDVLTAKTNLEKANAKNLVRGAAASAGIAAIDENYNRLSAETEQDLLVKNIDIKDQRRKDFAQTLSDVENNEKTAEQNALRTLIEGIDSKGALLNNLESAESEQKRNALSDLTSFDSQSLNDLAQVEGLERDRLLAALGLQLEGNKANLGQNNIERASKVSSILGLMGADLSKKTADRTYRLAKQGMGGSGSSSSSSGSSRDISGYRQEIESLVEEFL